MGTELLEPHDILPLVTAKVAEYGGAGKAAEHWQISLQMVHLVMKGQRRPARSILADLQLEAVPPDKTIKYRRIG